MARPVPLIVLTTQQEDVEFINRTLRDAGHPAHCHWVSQLDRLTPAIKTHKPQLVWLFADRFNELASSVLRLKTQANRSLPLIVIQEDASERAVTEAMREGARDLISTKYPERLCRVAERELRGYRLEHALSDSLHSARRYREQLKTFMAGSVDAIAHVQEGIVVDVNQAWAELFQRDADTLVGPLMDLFNPACHAVIKGGFVAMSKGQWNGTPLKVTAILGGGAELELDLLLEKAVYEDEPAIQLRISRDQHDKEEPAKLVDQAISNDAATGLYHRPKLLEMVEERLRVRNTAGVRSLALLRPDRFGELADSVGPLATEDVLVDLARIIKKHVLPCDICGRFGGNVFAIWVERGTTRDVEAWAENLLARISEHIFEVAQNSVSLSCTVGIAAVSPNTATVAKLMSNAQQANKRGRQRGGNQVVFEEITDETLQVQKFDLLWAQQIKSALVENRFQVGRLSIASLNAETKEYYDTLVTMIDQQGDEVAAATFVPVAVRTKLIRAIDRWVINESFALCANHEPDCLFVKLSADSVLDKELIPWLMKLSETSGAGTSRMCFQVSEDTAKQYLKQTKALSEQLSAAGFRFAFEHFGIGRDSARLLEQIPADFVKIDGSLMQSLADDVSQQEAVRQLITQAHDRGIATIAERVENANTMAVLFQLGMSYVQGHYVQEPEVVLEELEFVPIANSGIA
jgi:diguanylate cyclase (GGDEF)-like protein